MPTRTEKVAMFVFSYLVFITPGQIWRKKGSGSFCLPVYQVAAVGKNYVICSERHSSGNIKHVFRKREFRRALYLIS